ncbi:MAG: hypothetical protein R2695_15080 [Acidimicrobiales bacterium]
MADRLGHGTELRQFHRGREQPLKEMDAAPALRAELDRIRLTR